MSKQVRCSSSRLRHAQSLLSMLSFVTIAMSLLVQTRGQVSFSGPQSYAKYPGWGGLSSDDSLLRVVFRTSIGSGLLFYAEGTHESDSVPEALEIRLEEGRVVIEVQQRVITQTFGNFKFRETRGEKLYLGQNLNNNEPHTLSLQRTASQFTVNIDWVQSVTSGLLGSSSSPIGSEELYVGSLPSNITSPFSGSALVPLEGCVDSVQFVRNSSDPAALVSVEPIAQVGVTDGCPDPCFNASCGTGQCIALLPNRFFCDCSGTEMGGAYCNEDLSAHRLNLTLESYLCYGLTVFPLVDRTASVRLVPPIPASGTIMTGISATNDHFELYLQDGLVKLNYFYYNRSLVQLKGDQPLDSSLTYQIDIQLEQNRTQLVLSTVSGTQLTEIGQWAEDLQVSVTNGVFETICVGGSTVHVPYYEGLLEQVIFNRVPLSEQNLVEQASVELPTYTISFRSEFTEPPLIFDTMTFENNMRLTFEVRLQADGFIYGTPLAYGKDGIEITFLAANGQFLIISTPSADAPGFLRLDCSTIGVNIGDDSWHHIDVNVTRSSNGTANLRAVLDNNPSLVCESTTHEQRAILTSYLDILANMSAPMRFGVSTPADIGAGDDGIANFIGCFRNIEFRATPESSPIRPDISGVIRTEERFATGEECYSCTQQGEGACTGADVCADCGFFHPERCFSPGNVCSADTSVTPTTTIAPPPATTAPSETTSVYPTPSSTPTTTGTDLPVSALSVGAIAGIAVGGAVVLIVLVVLAIVLLYFCLRLGTGKQGFYKTEESNGKVASMVHYSASLRQISSEQVTVPETNGVSPMHADGLRPKEFYL